MMRVQQFAPAIAALVGCLFFIAINFVVPQSAASSPQQTHYLIKPLHADRVLYVQPRLALGNVAPESLLTSLEEISQRYAIKSSKLYTRQVHNREIPGLLVFTAPLTAQVTRD